MRAGPEGPCRPRHLRHRRQRTMWRREGPQFEASTPSPNQARATGGSRGCVPGGPKGRAQGAPPLHARPAKRTDEIDAARPQLAQAHVQATIRGLPPVVVVARNGHRHAARCHQIASIIAAQHRIGWRAIPLRAALERIPVVGKRMGRLDRRACPLGEEGGAPEPGSAAQTHGHSAPVGILRASIGSIVAHTQRCRATLTGPRRPVGEGGRHARCLIKCARTSGRPHVDRSMQTCSAGLRLVA